MGIATIRYLQQRQIKVIGSLTRLTELQATVERLSQQVRKTSDAAMTLVRYGNNTN